MFLVLWSPSCFDLPLLLLPSFVDREALISTLARRSTSPAPETRHHATGSKVRARRYNSNGWRVVCFVGAFVGVVCGRAPPQGRS